MENKHETEKWTEQHGLSSFCLHLLAMALMLCDHMWATVIPGSQWMTNIGRLAFPIFAFMIVEGYFHTHHFKRYLLRLLIWAVISEIPFDLIAGGTVFYPFHQNVLWTFLISLLGIAGMEKMRKKSEVKAEEGSKIWWLPLLWAMAIGVGCLLVGQLTMVDYQASGVMTVFVFYLFRGKKWWCRLGQLFGMILIHLVLFEGMVIDLSLFGNTIEFQQQGLAVLALIPIWLYSGKQGPHSKAIQTSFYAFYPLHMLILGLLALYVV